MTHVLILTTRYFLSSYKHIHIDNPPPLAETHMSYSVYFIGLHSRLLLYTNIVIEAASSYGAATLRLACTVTAESDSRKCTARRNFIINTALLFRTEARGSVVG
jgi:hypothetical protein